MVTLADASRLLTAQRRRAWKICAYSLCGLSFQGLSYQRHHSRRCQRQDWWDRNRDRKNAERRVQQMVE